MPAYLQGFRPPSLTGLCWALLAVGTTLGCNRSSATAPSPPAVDSSTFSSGSYAGLTGSYTLTLTASPSCAIVTDWISHQSLPFPDAARVRHYNADFSGISGTMTPTDHPGQSMHIGGIDRYVYYGLPLLRVNDGTLTVIVPPSAEDLAVRNDSLFQGGPTCSGGDYWWESLSPTEVFDICGTWRASLDDPNRIVGTIDGAFGYYKGVVTGPDWKKADLFCRAKDHQFTLTSR
jgi:hypothetical protein